MLLTRMLAAWVFALSALSAASAGPQSPHCHDDALVDRCDPEQQREMRELFGVVSIEEHQAAGDQVRRAFHVDGYANEVVAIAFIRARGKEPIVSVHFRRRGSRRPEPLVASVPEDTWNDVLRRSQYFDRRLVPLPGADREEFICLHPWLSTVEATDPPRPDREQEPARRHTVGGCADDLTRPYAAELARSALSLLSYCRSLDLSHNGAAVLVLEMCGKLRGDRNAAAAVMNRLQEFQRATRQETPDDVNLFMAPNAVIDWNGERRSESGDEDSAGRTWLARFAASNGYLRIDSVEAESVDRARVNGVIARGRRDSRDPQAWVDEEARVEIIWGPGCCGPIERITVGPFVAVPDR